MVVYSEHFNRQMRNLIRRTSYNCSQTVFFMGNVAYKLKLTKGISKCTVAVNIWM